MDVVSCTLERPRGWIPLPARKQGVKRANLAGEVRSVGCLAVQMCSVPHCLSSEHPCQELGGVAEAVHESSGTLFPVSRVRKAAGKVHPGHVDAFMNRSLSWELPIRLKNRGRAGICVHGCVVGPSNCSNHLIVGGAADRFVGLSARNARVPVVVDGTSDCIAWNAGCFNNEERQAGILETPALCMPLRGVFGDRVNGESRTIRRTSVAWARFELDSMLSQQRHVFLRCGVVTFNQSGLKEARVCRCARCWRVRASAGGRSEPWLPEKETLCGLRT